MKKLLFTCSLLLLFGGHLFADVENRATATWLFNQYGKGETIASTTSTAVVDFDGLYFAIGNNSSERTIVTEQAKLETDFKDGETVIFPKGWYTGLYSNAGRGKGYDKAANDTGGDGRLSLRINRPGKLYVLCRNYDASRLIGIFKGNATTAAATSAGNTDLQMLTVEIDKSELQTSSSYDKYVICHITGYNGSNVGNGFKIYGVKYVVSEDAAEMSKTVTIPSCGYATFSGPHTYTISSVTNSGSATAWYASAEDSETGKITLSQTGKKRIAPSQGFIIMGTPGETATLKSVTEQISVEGTNLLVANLALYQLPVSSTINKGSDQTYYNYILVADGTSSAVFKHTTGEGNLVANKAFLRTTTNVTSGSGPAPAIHFEFEEENGETALTNVGEAAKTSKFIENGRVLIQKNGITYDVMGRVVR